MHHFPALSSLAILTKMDATNEIVPGAGSLASKALYITLGEIPPCHSMKSFDSEGLGGHFKGRRGVIPQTCWQWESVVQFQRLWQSLSGRVPLVAAYIQRV
jgi:hypothetical protein